MATKAIITVDQVKELVTNYAANITTAPKKAEKIAAKLKTVNLSLLQESYKSMSETEEQHLLAIVPGLFENQQDEEE